MAFDDVSEWAWGEKRPGDASAFSTAAVEAWASKFTGAQFVVIGRCCDLGSTEHNKNLAVQRAQEGARLIADEGRQVYSCGEQTPFSGPAAVATEVNAIGGGSQLDGNWLIKEEHPEYTGWDSSNRALPPRPSYRRIDVFALGGTVAPDAPKDPTDAAPSRPRSCAL